MKKYTSVHHIFLLLCVTLISIKTYPILFFSLGGRDTWLLILFSAIVVTLLGYYVINKFIKLNIPSINDLFIYSFGKFLGGLFLFIFALLLLFNAVESVSILSTSIHNAIFIQSPVWYGLLFFIIAGAYMLSMGFSSLLKLAISSITLVIISAVFLALALIQYHKFNYITPILGNPLNSNSGLAVIYILGYFSSLGITFPYLKKIQDKENLKKYYLITMLVVCLLSTLSIISALGFFNYFRASNIFFPEFVEAQRIEYGKFFESGELFVIVQNVLGFMVKYLLSLFGIYIIFKNKIKKANVFFILISILVYILSYYSSKNIFTLFSLLELFTLGNFIFMVIIPLFATFIYGLRYNSIKKRLKSN